MYFISYLYGLTIICIVTNALPVAKTKELTEEQKKEALKDEPPVLQDWELSLEYGRYLKEVVQVLESDKDFRHKLEKAEPEDIKSGKIARELNFVDHNVRNKLDELKRRELERLRHYAVQEQEKNTGVDRSKLKMPVHIDPRNPTRFEVEDLRKLIQQTTQDLEAVDRQRKKEFTNYEMKKEYEYEQKLAKMTPEERKKAEEQHKAAIKKHKEHPKLHHPGSKQQLEEVWEEQDHMNKDDFDPKNFFHLHDLDGNGVWDENEVKTLFLKELDKMYDPNASEDDLEERHEEMERMREHIFQEADTNRDNLISLEEFITQTQRNEFEQDEGWQGLDEQELYSPQEYEQFQRNQMHQMEQAGPSQGYNGQPIAGHDAARQQVPQQQVPQHQQQVPQHQQQVPQHQQQQVPQQQQIPQHQQQQILQKQVPVPQQQVSQQQAQQQVSQQQAQQQVSQQQAQQQVPQQQAQQQVPQQQAQQQVPQQQAQQPTQH